MPALRRGLWMGRNLHHAVRPERAVPQLDRLQQRGQSGLKAGLADAKANRAPTAYLEPRSYQRRPRKFISTLFLLAAIALAFAPRSLRAGDATSFPEYDPETACHEIKAALNA